MREKTKKVYEAPSMKVYKIGRTLILAGSELPTGQENFDTDSQPMQW